MQIDLNQRPQAPLGLLLLAAAILLIVSCGPQEIVEEPFEPTSSHQNYREGLSRMEIADTAIGSRWIAVAERALDEPKTVDLPYREIAHFEPTRPEAVGFQFEALRGQRIEITLELEEAEGGRMFADGRDGGRRTHEGVDIFAPRHTRPATLACSPSRRVGFAT